MTPTAYFQGQYIPENEANVNIKTHAFLYGTSVFEGIRGYWNPDEEAIYLFQAKEHFERMLQSAKFIFLETDLDVDKLLEISRELIVRNQFKSDVYLQPRLYKSGHVIPPKLANVDTDYCCFMLPFGDYLDVDKGLNVCVSSWRRVSDNAIPPRGKVGGAYVNSALIAAEAHNNGFDDGIVLTEAGHVSEGSAMNLFIVRNGKLITTRNTDNILEGITRAAIMEIARNEMGLEVEARKVDRTELYVADEAFFVGTATQVAPITRIDSRPVGTGTPGPIAQELKQRYIDIAKGKNPKYRRWLTEVKLHAHAR